MTQSTPSITPGNMYVQINDRVLCVRAWAPDHFDLELADASYLRALVDVCKDGKLIFRGMIDRVDEAKGAVSYVFSDPR